MVYNLGTCHYFLHEYADAERLYRQAIADFPDKPDYHFQLGSTLWDQQRLQEAVPCYRRAAQLYEKQQHESGLSAEDFEHLAMSYVRSGQPQKAINVYRAKLVSDGGMADTYYMIAAVYMGQEDYANAAGNFAETAARLRTQTGNRVGMCETLQYLGQCYLALGRVAEARGALAEALRLMPPTYLQKAQLQALMRDAQSAPLDR